MPAVGHRFDTIITVCPIGNCTLHHFASLCITLHNFAIWDRANIILETLQRNLQNKPRNEHCVQKSVQPLAASRWHSHPQMTEFARPVSLKTWKEQSIFAQETLQFLFMFYSYSIPFLTFSAILLQLLVLTIAFFLHWDRHKPTASKPPGDSMSWSCMAHEVCVYIYIYHIILYIYVYD